MIFKSDLKHILICAEEKIASCVARRLERDFDKMVDSLFNVTDYDFRYLQYFYRYKYETPFLYRMIPLHTVRKRHDELLKEVKFMLGVDYIWNRYGIISDIVDLNVSREERIRQRNSQ